MNAKFNLYVKFNYITATLSAKVQKISAILNSLINNFFYLNK